jgi:hypothetical protein
MKLLFVYNADSGLFNSMADAAHKIFSPRTYQCDLCRITYGWLQERAEWRVFIDRLGVDCEFLHRDQFRATYPHLDVPLPAILRDDDEQVTTCVDPSALAACVDVQALIHLVQQRCTGMPS